MAEIKYHQYGISNSEYASDGCLTNNWNPDADYGEEYANVYFNINTNCFDSTGTFKTDKERTDWHEEVSNLLKRLGIFEDSGWKVEHSEKKQAYLYAHPSQISGVIRKNDIKRVAEAIMQMKLSTLRWVDIYKTIYVMTDEEYEQYLNTKETEMEAEILRVAVTTRSNKYLSMNMVAKHVAATVRLYRLGINDGCNYGTGLTEEHIKKLMFRMKELGVVKIAEKKAAYYIRSANKTELKRLKRKAA